MQNLHLPGRYHNTTTTTTTTITTVCTSSQYYWSTSLVLSQQVINVTCRVADCLATYVSSDEKRRSSYSIERTPELSTARSTRYYSSKLE